MTLGKNNTYDPTLLDVIRRLGDLVRVALGNPVDFGLKWEVIISAFAAWMIGLPAAVSPISRNLELLRRIEDAFHTTSLRENDAISALLLNGTAKPGEEVKVRGQAWLVVSRAVSANYGVEYTLINEKGEQLRHEFFD